MKAIIAIGAFLFSLGLFAQEFTVKDGMCGSFGFYYKKPCLLIIENEGTSAGVLLDSKYVMSIAPSVKEIVGKRVEVDLSKLLMLTLEEEENIRGHLDYPEARYYSATPKEFRFLR